ncbi:MAG: hypothetical protein M9933_08810 [Chitinophagaceae bacterium]|nr:hypothetical protein [Chitinophagaceae bacterium]
MKNAKIKLSGLVLSAAFFAFSVISCSQPDNKTSENSDATAPAVAATAATNVATGPQTITGEILDMSCYMDHDALGESHKKCAQGCLDKGLPAGILGENGQVYLLVEDHDASDAYKTALQHAAEKITVSGTVVNKNGVQSLIVKEVNTQG